MSTFDAEDFQPLSLIRNSWLLSAAELAIGVRQHAYCPYSGFAVGAVVVAESGTLFAGCNVENASYSLTNCAERVAVQDAISAGEHVWRAMVIASRGGAGPCGACRQVVFEFAPQLEIWLVDVRDDQALITVAPQPMDHLLPGAFQGDSLRSKTE